MWRKFFEKLNCFRRSFSTGLGSLQFFSEHSLEKPSFWRETNDGNVKCHLTYEQALLWGIGQRESKKASLTMRALTTTLTVFSGLLEQTLFFLSKQIRPFLRGLFLEGLLFGGAYLWREICVSKSIGLALQLEVNWPFLLYFSLYLRAISKYKPLGGIYSEWRFNRGFLALWAWGGYIWRGLYMEGLIFRILQ